MSGGALKGRKSNNPAGKPKGQTKKGKQWDALGEYITGAAADKLNEELSKLTGIDYVNAMTKILSYFKPQLARTEIKEEKEVPKIVFENVSDKYHIDKDGKSKENVT